MSDLLKDDSVLLKVFSISQSSQRSLGDDWLVWIPARVYCLFVCKWNLQLCFLMSKTYLWSTISKKDFYKLTNSVRNIHNHAKVEKTSATCNNKRWFVVDLNVLRGLKHGMGDWWLVKRTISLSCKINWYFMVIYILRLNCFFLNLFTHLPNSTKEFLQLLKNISNNPLPHLPP